MRLLKKFYNLEKYHFERFLTNNAWIQKMSVEEWAFFTERQNPCGTLEDPINGKLSCKLKRGTAFCKERLKLREKTDCRYIPTNLQKHFSHPKY